MVAPQLLHTGQEEATSQRQRQHHLTEQHQAPQVHLLMGSLKFRSMDLLDPASKIPYIYIYIYIYMLTIKYHKAIKQVFSN